MVCEAIPWAAPNINHREAITFPASRDRSMPPYSKCMIVHRAITFKVVLS